MGAGNPGISDRLLLLARFSSGPGSYRGSLQDAVLRRRRWAQPVRGGPARFSGGRRARSATKGRRVMSGCTPSGI